LSPEDVAILQRLAQERGCTVSEVVRQLVRAQKTAAKSRSKKGR